MKYIKHVLLTIIVAVWGCFSSCNYLNVDDYFLDTFSYDSIFASEVNVERYLWTIPTYFDDEGAVFGNCRTPGVGATDECIPTWDTDEFLGTKYARGLITADNQTRFFDTWINMYRVVRKVNVILANIGQVPDLSTQKKSEMLGYAYFMRAYAYYQILVDYGPLLILDDDVLAMNEEMGYYDRARSTFDESVEYVCTEFERAARYLPDRGSLAVNQFGRPHRDAAYALVARLRLLHASEAYNGGEAARRYFSGWKRQTDGVDYVSQTEDNRRWAVAAHAAKRLIDKGYTLHTVPRDELTPELPSNVSNANFPDGAGDIDPYKSYKDMFSGEAIGYKNPEFIWAMTSASVRNYVRHSFPVGTLSGWGGLGITQKVVDAYYMADGTEYTAAGVDEQEKIGAGKTFSGYQLLAGTSEMYNNREMRFYASIGFQNRLWICNSTTDNGKRNFVANFALDGNCGKLQALPSPTDFPLTGYLSVKYTHDDDAYTGNGATQTQKYFPIIRYAEILLSYAEALNNIEGSYTVTDTLGQSGSYTRDYNEIARCFNQVRYRAGLPGIPQGLSKDAINKLIQRERMVEFFLENRRYYDVRRWGIYDKVDAEPIMGMNIEGAGDAYFRRVQPRHVNVRTRITAPKLVLLPIWKNELRKMPLLDQNPGWTR